jgi:uncharacterized RDD family membrane protein YckC
MVSDAASLGATTIVPSGLRRVSAWLIDYFLVAIYMGIVFFVVFVVTGGRLEIPGVSTPGARQLLGAATLTIPVLLYFALCEASARQGTIGKQATRLRVVGRDHERIGLGRSLVRSGLKFAPWEIAHTAIHRIPLSGDIPWPVWAGLVVSMLLSLAYLAALFTGHGRTPYDALAGTRVVEDPPSPLTVGTPVSERS